MLFFFAIAFLFIVMTLTSGYGMNDPKINALATAIGKAEGFGIPGAIPTIRDNPGDIEERGVVKTFENIAAGESALYAQIKKIVDGTSKYYNLSMSWYDFAATWTGRDNWTSWAETVASQLGVNPNSTLAEYFNA